MFILGFDVGAVGQKQFRLLPRGPILCLEVQGLPGPKSDFVCLRFPGGFFSRCLLFPVGFFCGLTCCVLFPVGFFCGLTCCVLSCCLCACDFGGQIGVVAPNRAFAHCGFHQFRCRNTLPSHARRDVFRSVADGIAMLKAVYVCIAVLVRGCTSPCLLFLRTDSPHLPWHICGVHTAFLCKADDIAAGPRCLAQGRGRSEEH